VVLIQVKPVPDSTLRQVSTLSGNADPSIHLVSAAIDIKTAPINAGRSVNISFVVDIPKFMNTSLLCLAYVNPAMIWQCTPFPLNFDSNKEPGKLWAIGTTSHFSVWAVVSGAEFPHHNSAINEILANEPLVFGVTLGITVFLILFAIIMGRLFTKLEKRAELSAINKELQMIELPMKISTSTDDTSDVTKDTKNSQV